MRAKVATRKVASRSPRALTAALMVMLACATKGDHEASLSEREILQFIQGYDAAVLAKDTSALLEQLDSSYVYFGSRGSIQNRQWVVDLVTHPSYRLQDMTRTEIEPRLYGTFAVVATRWTATPYYMGTRYDDDQRCVLLIQRRGSEVRLLSEHCTEITE
jgi:hypothetical protein